MNLQEAVNRYILETLQPRQPKYKTLYKAKNELRMLTSHFGPDRDVETISTRDISDWRYAMLSSGLAAATVNRRQQNLRAILNKARRWGVPVQPVEFDLLRLPAPSSRYLSDDEYRRLLGECHGWLKTLVVLLAETGGRLGEVTGLRWMNVTLDDDDRPVAVTYERTKNGKSRTVPLTRAASEALRKMKRGQPDERVLEFDRPKSSWDRARCRAGLPWLRLHDLRHYFCSRLIRRGANTMTVQRLSGHATVGMLSRYTHLSTRDLDATIRLLD